MDPPRPQEVDRLVRPLVFSFPLSANTDTVSSLMPGMNPRPTHESDRKDRENPSLPGSGSGSPAVALTPSESTKDVSTGKRGSGGIPSTSVYPRNLAQKQFRRFARSADKRQSVHLLGNIEHLQHHFMKFGLAAAEAIYSPDLRGPLRPALGLSLPSHTVSASSPTTTSPPESQTAPQLLPPSPLKPATVPMPPYPLGTDPAPKIDLVQLRREASRSLREVERVWKLERLVEGDEDVEREDQAVTVTTLELLKVTLHAIKVVRSFALAIPTSSLPREKPNLTQTRGLGVGLPPHARRVSAGPGNRQSISTPSRPAGRAVSVGAFPVASMTGNQTAAAAAAAASSYPTSSAGEDAHDPLVELRKSALDVLTALKALEERYRIEESDLLAVSEDLAGSPLVSSRAVSPYPQSEGFVDLVSEPAAAHTNPAQANLGIGRPTRECLAVQSVSGSSVSGRGSASPTIFFLDDDNHEAYFFAEREGLEEDRLVKKTWYERLTDGEDGWLYQSDVRVVQDCAGERDVVERYLNAVERVLYVGGKTRLGQRGGRAWNPELTMGQSVGTQGDGRVDIEGETARRLAGLEEEGDENSARDRVPNWAREDRSGGILDRAHEFISSHLPADLVKLLPDPNQADFEVAFLDRLSDGFILITAHNTAIQRSAASWGFVVQEDIHDTIKDTPGVVMDGAESGVRARDWTFRRAGNLRAWGAALRHRHRLPLAFPSQVTALKHAIPLEVTHVPQRKTSASVPVTAKPDTIPYDPLLIARRSDGWEDTLMVVMDKWMNALGREVRSELGST